MPGKQGVQQQVNSLFAYWFVGRDRLATTTFERLWYTALNRLRLRPDRWAYVVVQTVVLPGETEAEAQARMDEVTSQLQTQLAPVALR